MSAGIGEGQPADEQAHGEADAAEQRDAVELRPGRAARQAGEAEADRPARRRPNTPTCLPTNSPAAIAERHGLSRSASVKPAKETPALAKPKSGTIRNATQGCRPCSSRCSGESSASGAPARARTGWRSASSTPAIVAWTPDSSTSEPEHQRRAAGRAQRMHAERLRPHSAPGRHRAASRARAVELGGVEQRDDRAPRRGRRRWRARQEHLERCRHPRPQQRQHAEREGDVGRGRDGPAAPGRRRVADR